MSQLQNDFARFGVGPAPLPPRSAFERSAATPEALQNGKITQAADKIIAKKVALQLTRMKKIKVVLGFDMETDIGSWTNSYAGFRPGTEHICAVLKTHDVPATFYFTGDAAKKNPEVARALDAAGHEVGAHSLFHETIGDPLFEIPGMIPVLPEEVEHRLELNTRIIEEITGTRPRSFRCPRLFGSTAVINALESLGYRSDASYPMYFYRQQLKAYHPSRTDWTQTGDMNLVELPNFADLTMESNDPYGRDRDQWPRWRTEGAAALMGSIRNHIHYCGQRDVEPFLCFYMHPWEFHPMPEGLIRFGEGAVRPDPFIVRNCGDYATEQLDVLIGELKRSDAEFFRAGEVTVK